MRDPARALIARGSTIRATLDVVATIAGDEARDRVVAALPARARKRVRETTATDDVPFALWVRLADATQRVIGAAVPDWPELAGARDIESLGVELSAGILRKWTPLAFATQCVSLFGLSYHPGRMTVVETESIGERGGRVVLRLDGFAHESPLFCRRQTGGLAEAVAIAGGERPRARHVRCTLEGDAFCEWELRWE